MSSKKLYLYVTPFFPSPNNWRGSYCYDQVMALKRSEQFCDIMVFMPCRIMNSPQDHCFNGVNVYSFKTYNFPSYILNGFFNKLNEFFFLRKLKALNIKIDDIEIIHAHTTSLGNIANSVKRLNSSIKTVLQHHDLDPVQIRNGKFARSFWNAHFRAKNSIKIIKNIDVNVCISKAVEDNLKSFPHARAEEVFQPYLQALIPFKEYDKIEIKKSIILHNGVDCNIFYKLPQTKDEFFRIGCIGNFVDLKDQISLIKAVEKLKIQIPNIRLSLVGSGPMLKQCVEYVEEHKLEDIIVFEKEVFHESLNKYYNNLDLFILPSFFEGLGCVFLEAAACKVPFLTCKNQGVNDFIRDAERLLWLFSPRDDEDIAQKILYFFKNNPKQNLNREIEINILIKEYLHSLNQ